MDITKDTILQAWRSEEYRAQLPDDVRKTIPAKPAHEDGSAMSDQELEQAAGGTTPLAGLGVAEAVGLGSAAGAAFTGGVAAGLSD